ncbi:MAG: hypothetical protein AAF411_17830 [Myxococcota bacterium]
MKLQRKFFAALSGVAVLWLFIAPSQAEAYTATCSFSDGASWVGEAPTTELVAAMGLRCADQGGSVSYGFSDFWEMLFF